MPGYYIKQGNVGIGEAVNPDATLTVKSIRAADVSLRVENCDTTQTGNLIEAYGTGGSAVLTVSIAGVLSTSAALYLYDGTSAAPGLAFSADSDTGIYRPADNQISLVALATPQMIIDGDTAGSAQCLMLSASGLTSPTYSFIGDTDTGIYTAAANTISIVAATSAILTIDGDTATSAQVVALSATGVAAPTYSFIGDINTGMYHPATDQVALVAGGSALLVIDGDTALSAQTLAYSATGATAPSYSFIGETGTGMFCPASKQLAFAAGSTAVMYLDGDTALSAQMLMLSATGAAAPSYSFYGDENTGIYHNATDQMSFVAGGTAMLVLDGDTALSAQTLAYSATGATAPTYSFIGDTDNGMFLTATDKPGFAAGGTAVMILDGATPLCAQMLMLSATGETSPSYSFIGEENTGMYLAAAKSIRLATYGVDAMLLDGATAPANPQIAAPSAAAATWPGFGFIEDGDTGMANITNNKLSLIAGASAVAVIDGATPGSAQVLVMSGGDGVLAPGYSFVNDTDTGIALNAGGKIGVIAAGALISTFSSNGLCAIAGGITVDGGNFVVGTGCSASITDAKGFILAASGTPSTSSESGTAGNIMWDGSNIYVCVATNTWKKASIAAF